MFNQRVYTKKSPTSNTSREDPFSCHCLKPFTFEVVCDMHHLIFRGGVYILQSSLFFFMASVLNQNSSHTLAELGWLIWAAMQTWLLNLHNEVKPGFHSHLGSKTTQKKKASAFREKRVAKCFPKWRDKGKNFAF